LALFAILQQRSILGVLGSLFCWTQYWLIVSDLFRFELLRRYPNIDGALFAKHAGKVESALKKQYQDQLLVPLWAAWTDYNRESVEGLLFDLYQEAAKAKGMSLYQRSIRQSHPFRRLLRSMKT
jgi:hypothetical protein